MFLVDGRRRAVDRRPPFVFSWNAARAKPGKHVLEVVATSVDGRIAQQRIPLVAAAAQPNAEEPKPRRHVRSPRPLEDPRARAPDGQEVTGLVLWRVDVAGTPTRVEFLVDGVAPRRRRRGALHARLELGRGGAGAASPDRPRGRQRKTVGRRSRSRCRHPQRAAVAQHPDQLRVELAGARQRHERVDDPRRVAGARRQHQVGSRSEREPRPVRRVGAAEDAERVGDRDPAEAEAPAAGRTSSARTTRAAARAAGRSRDRPSRTERPPGSRRGRARDPACGGRRRPAPRRSRRGVEPSPGKCFAQAARPSPRANATPYSGRAK